jgi:hypothetical protein
MAENKTTESTPATQPAAETPKKPGLFARANSAVKEFAYEHPIITGFGVGLAVEGTYELGKKGASALKARFASKATEQAAAGLFSGSAPGRF